ncbi:uncharacterized protein LOC128274293 [Anopheles cruzii]|uniref:uncharacterized protein LOC128274293 n=1 Tax=Anopheles cruzii TaxID=68878 RepID=UPI0022EC37CE|nr:uncharacterized protein LOC128274293 [Anopheles cruzii]
MFKPVSFKLDSPALCSEQGGYTNRILIKNKTVGLKVQREEFHKPSRKQLKIPLLTFPSTSGGQRRKLGCSNRKVPCTRLQPHGSHTTELIPERFQFLYNANTLHKLKQVLAVTGRFLRSNRSTVTPFQCGANPSFYDLQHVQLQSTSFAVLQNEQNRKQHSCSTARSNVLGITLETFNLPPASTRAFSSAAFTAKLHRRNGKRRKSFQDLSSEQHLSGQCMPVNKPSTLLQSEVEKVLRTYHKHSIQWHLEYLQSCQFQAETIRHKFRTSRLFSANGHIDNRLLNREHCGETLRCDCTIYLAEVPSFDQIEQISMSNFSLGPLSEEKQQKLHNLLDSLYQLNLESAGKNGLPCMDVPKIILTDYSTKSGGGKPSGVGKRECYNNNHTQNAVCDTDDDPSNTICSGQMANSNTKNCFLKIPEFTDSKQRTGELQIPFGYCSEARPP